ncbi:hypothetical protein [Fibrella arboris]|uniref:hypothetical protein n=1 Tax=Fibrella arboris TaxID=3242486 RepID=UPI0035220B94
MLAQTLTITLRHWPLLVLLFLLALLPALPVTLAFFSTLNSEAAESLAPLQLLPGFNYTVFADFMHVHGHAVWPLIRAGWWTSVLSLLLGVWAKGGILYSFSNGFSAVTFWQSATHYFSRNLRLLGVTALFASLWLLLLITVGLLLGTLLAEALDDPFTERGYVATGAVVLLLFGLALARILCTSQYASVLLFATDQQIAFRAYGQSWRFVGQHWLATFGRYLLLILIGTGLFGIYFLAESLFQAHSWLLIVLLLLLQQAFVCSRVVLTVWSLRIAFDTTRQIDTLVSQHRTPYSADK